MSNQPLLAASIFLTFACSSQAMHGDTSELAAALADERAENARHEQACAVADSMPAALAELGRHEQAMDGMMARMDRGMHEMSACSRGDNDRVSTGMSNARTELGEHSTRLRAALDLPVARHECARYAPAMDAALLSMSMDLSQMSCMRMGH